MDKKSGKRFSLATTATTTTKITLESRKTIQSSHRAINGFGNLNANVHANVEEDVLSAANVNTNAKSAEKASPYFVPDSPEVQTVKATLNRIANQGTTKAVLVMDPSGKLAHVQYPTSGVGDFDARHMKMDDFKLLTTVADDFIRDINPKSYLKTLRLRGKNGAIVMEFEPDKSCVACVQRTKFVQLFSKNHI